MAQLMRSDRTTYWPHKGDAAYYSIPVGGEPSIDPICVESNVILDSGDGRIGRLVAPHRIAFPLDTDEQGSICQSVIRSNYSYCPWVR
jgi:hypothetical protein